MPGAVVGQRPTRHQAVQVDMTHQRLAPGVEHGGHAHLAIQAFGIGAEFRERRPHRLEQEVIDLLGLDLDPAVEGVGQGEHQVMVGHRQQRGALAFAPGLGGVALAARAVAIAARMVEQRAFPARVACQRKAAQGGGPALGDVMADLPLVRTQ